MKKVLIIFLTIMITACSNMSNSNTNSKSNTDPTKYFAEKNLVMANAINKQDTGDIIRLIKEEGYNVNTRDSIQYGKELHQWTYLNYAVDKEKLKSAETLLKLGANPNDILILGGAYYSNMNLACKDGNKAMIKLLLKYHAKVDSNLTESPLAELMTYDHNDTKLYDLLIQNGADVNHPTYISGTPPLFTAYDINNHQMIDYLLSKGANPLQIDSFGNSFASLLDKDIKENINVKTAKKYKQRMISEYGIQYPVKVSYRKGIEQAIKRYENTTAGEKKIMGQDEIDRINKDRKSLKTGYSNGIAID